MTNKNENKFLNYIYDYLIKEELMSYENKPKDLNEKIEREKIYLKKLKKVHEMTLNSKRDVDLKRLKKLYYDRYIIKKENIGDKYFENQEKLYLERGYGHHSLNNEEKEILSATLINDQKKSLDAILDYFFSEDSKFYPDLLKFWAFQGLINLGNYDKEKREFKRRTPNTVNIFVSINREALALTIDDMNKYIKNEKIENEDILKLVDTNIFKKIYTYRLNYLDQIKKDRIDTNKGIWIKYDMGSDHRKLVKSLEGKGTGWCTAGEETAKSQLKNGDFYVYYTLGSESKYTEPRIAIRMNGKNEIREIRGVASNQHLESEMEEVLEEKLEEFKDADNYKKKVSDMKKLTYIYKKHNRKEELTKEELSFLYEINDNIKSFGYSEDPRIEEIQNQRDKKSDLAFIFNCSKEEIGIFPEKINNRKLKYYYGNLYLDELTSTEGLILPENIGGDLGLSSLTSIEGLKLPKNIRGSLSLCGLTSAEGLKLPENIGGSLYFDCLISAEGLNLPENIVEDLYLDSLTNIEGLELPKNIGGGLYLCSLTSADGLKLPENIGGNIYLYGLTSVEGLLIPSTISLDKVFMPENIKNEYILKMNSENNELQTNKMHK